MIGEGQGTARRREAGHAMAALLVGLAIAAVVMSAVVPAWRAQVQREREEELIFRGTQYARAIQLYQRKFAGAFPASVDLLVQQKYLRKAYKDPMSGGDFEILYQGTTMQLAGQVGASRTPGQVVPGPGQPATGPGIVTVPGPGQAPGGLGGVGPIGRPGGTGSFGQAGPRGGIVGVVSKVNKASFRLYNGRANYREWQFLFTQAGARGPVQPGTQPGGVPGQQRPGMPGGVPGSTRPGAVSPRQ